MKDKILIIPGGFVPYNDTVTLIVYKRLRNLKASMDVLAFKGKEDQGILFELLNDDNYKKFNIEYLCAYDNAIAINKPLRLPLALINMTRYVLRSLSKFKKGNYNIIYTASLPGIPNICGYFIKKKYPDVKWIASFSDIIEKSPYKYDPELKNRSILYRLAFRVGSFIYMNDLYERLAVINADELVFICDEQRDFILSHYDNKEALLKKSRIEELTYIPEWKMYKDLLENKSIKHTPKIAVHLGRLYGLRKIDNFLEALKELKKEDQDLASKIIFRQYSEIQKKDLEKIKEYDLGDVFKVFDKVSYDISIKTMKEADVLVLFDTIMHNEPLQPYLPSKILEYSLLRKPILATCEANSPSYRLLKDKEHCYVGNEVEEIKNNIKKIINN